MTVPVHFATTDRTIRHTGRDRASVPMHAHMNGTIAGHGLPPHHQIHSLTATAHTAGTGMLTTTTTHARTNPTAALAGHDTSCRMTLPSYSTTPASEASGNAPVRADTA
jgi:hypothetical protein